MSQNDSARSDLPAGGQEELSEVSHSERMMADMMKMLANLTMMENQQPLQQQQQQTAAAAGDRGLQQQMAAVGGRVEESVELEKDASSRAVVSSWGRPRQNWRACPVKDGKQAWREATRAFGLLVKHP